ncbi:MAG: hypothetical protein HFJ17_06005 [Clostridia bacterium]|nr:hypothetical protein [Clostridia bacterium]
MKLNKLLGIFIAVVLIVFIMGTINCYAATGSFSVSKSSISLKKGKTATITVSVKNCEGVFTVSSSDTTVATVNKSSTGWLERSTTITITAKKAGTATINITASDVADTSEKEVRGTKTIKVNVTETSSTGTNNNTNNKPSSNNSNNNSNNNSDDTSDQKPEVSKDATLKNLGVTPSKYDFSGFRKMTTSYSVSVPHEVETISLYGYATDSKATVSGTGSKKLKDGVNTFSVKVTAEDKKTTKIYTVKVTREKEKSDEEEPKEDENPEETKAEGLTDLSITDLELTPSFDNKQYEYSVNVPNGTTSLDINTQKSDDNIEIQIAGNENLQIGENIITILVYDKKKNETATYQIAANVEEEKTDLTEVNDSIKHAKNDMKTRKYIILGVVAIIVILVIVFFIKRQSIVDENEFTTYKREDNIEENEEDEKETVKKNRRKPKGKRFK